MGSRKFAEGDADPVIPLYLVKLYYLVVASYNSTTSRYLTLYYEAEGLTATEIGSIMAVANVIATCMTPLVNAAADRSKRAGTLQRWALVASSVPAVALAIPVGPGGSKFLVRSAAHLAFALCDAPVKSLSDPLARAACTQDADKWGRARFYGCIGWAIMHLALGPAIDEVGFLALLVANFIMRAFYYAASRHCVPEACSSARAEVSMRTVCGILMRNKLFFFNITAIGICFAMAEGMLFLYLSRMHASTFLCGLAVAVSVTLELPIFGNARYFLSRLGHRRMILLGQAVLVVRTACYATASSAWTAVIIELLHGLTYALVWTAAVDYCSKPAVCGEGLEASAQGLLGSCFMGIGHLVGFLMGGLLFDTVGTHMTYAIFGACVSLSGLVYWLLGEEARGAGAGAAAGALGKDQREPVLRGGGGTELTAPDDAEDPAGRGEGR